jgi:hypothetical protein
VHDAGFFHPGIAEYFRVIPDESGNKRRECGYDERKEIDIHKVCFYWLVIQM